MSLLDRFKKLFGDESTSFIKNANQKVQAINTLETSLESLSNEELRAKTAEFRKQLADGETLENLIVPAFAVAREASRRTLGMRHYDVQLIGGLAIHAGSIAEMRTGEGKTLVATLPVYLNALTGKGVHVVTVNDYLARRDAVWMGQVYNFLGLSVSVVNQENTSYMYDDTVASKEDDTARDTLGSFKIAYDFLRPCTRKEAYEADITYGTNNEFGFDYLRDNLAIHKDQLVQRKHFFAVVDEIDSILIDEARTPLIISQPGEESGDLYLTFAKIAKSLVKEEDYGVDEKLRAVTLTDKGIEKAEQLLGISNIYTEKGMKYVHHLETAVRAEALFAKDKEYVVNNGEVIIVDQSTGRMMPGRRFNMGLHQALEAKEGVLIKRESKTAASITYQNYFKFYEKLSGMTGTAQTSKEEFLAVYRLPVISIPTNKSVARIDHNDLIFFNKQAKFKAIANKIQEVNRTGQPILVGTISIEQNELLSEYLRSMGVRHEVLNAKKHEQEGQVIAQAGRKGAVVIATNMAGRGIDIKLGGEPTNPEEADEIRRLGGLFVLGTERHDSRRIDNQLRGRAGRQGDPGQTQFFISLDDELARVFGGDRLKSMVKTLKMPEDEPISHGIISKSVESAQKKVEGFQFDSRKSTLEYDNVLNTQRNTVYGRRRKMLLSSNEEVEEYLNSLLGDNKDLVATVTEKTALVGKEQFWTIVRRVVLHVTDTLWMEHLDSMAYLRNSVNLRAYGQRDPIIEYKKEGLQMFRAMEDMTANQIIDLIKTIHLPENGASAPSPVPERTIPEETSPTLKKYDRNDRVVLVKDGQEKEMKFKKIDEFLKDGWKIKE
jgi:preprotein translocase subunit SecA